ncbi:MAG TPA: BamA/TamA family outer membrane protein, partial [Steroidobacteraceae bacterium]|nr:BamA/TamA family outer membrane protein [Steroidobacteraceae bacterium]
MKKSIALLAVLISIGLAGCVVASPPRRVAVVEVGVRPPPPRVVVVPASRRGHVWAAGYWRWDGHRHVWVDGQWMRALGSRFALRLDLRHDHGMPLGGAVFLPEVERFFAGGDNTVRGYAEDRLAVEEIALAVPPLCCLEQVIILPAGGNIRTVGNIDLEVKLARL